MTFHPLLMGDEACSDERDMIGETSSIVRKVTNPSGGLKFHRGNWPRKLRW